MNYQIPEGFIYDHNSGLYYKDEIVTGHDNRPVRLVTWYDPNTGQFNPVYYEIKEEAPPVKPQNTVSKKSGNGKTIALIVSSICLIALVTVGVVGFQMGWFNTFLSGENTAVLPENIPNMLQPNNTSPSENFEEELPPSSSEEDRIEANVSELEVIMLVGDFPPYNTGSDGADTEFISALGELLDIDITTTRVEFDYDTQFWANNIAGIDTIMIPGYYISEEDANYSIPYFTYEHYVISTSSIQNLEDLAGLRIGVQMDSPSYGVAYIATLSPAEYEFSVAHSNALYGTGAQIMSYDTAEMAIKALESGDVDVVLTNQVFASQEPSGISALPLLYQGDNVQRHENFIAVPKHNEELLEAINSAIEILENSGQIDEWILEFS